MATSAQMEFLEPEAHYAYFAERGVRPDGRAFDEQRPVNVTIHTPNEGVGGSASVLMGSTRVLGSVSLQVGTPDLASPSDGDLGARQPLSLSRVHCLSSFLST